ncbi:MAG: hypothetical protein CL934_13670 [Deltaproteobacteria bacterium]|nr:hypothetical protein [Deltaproteobacteria bacterium]
MKSIQAFNAWASEKRKLICGNPIGLLVDEVRGDWGKFSKFLSGFYWIRMDHQVPNAMTRIFLNFGCH